MKKEKMNESVGLSLVSVALAVLVAVLPVVRAFAFSESTGQTKVDVSNNCSGGVVTTPADGTWHLNANPDYVYVPYKVSWEDARNPNPRPKTAYHNFTLDAVHLSDPVKHDEKRVQTNGGVSQTFYTLSVNVTNVYSGQYVNVTFTASLHGSPLLTGCPVDGSVTGHYLFVYP